MSTSTPERKSASGAVEVKDESAGTVEAVFSTFNVIDADGDVTLPGAIKDGSEALISAYGHASWGGTLPVGKGTIRTNDNEATFVGQFFMKTAHGRDTFEVVKETGGLQEWSYGLVDITAEPGEFEGKDVRFIKSVRVPEVSPVLMGSGVNTRTLSAKSAGATYADEGEQVLAACEQFTTRSRELAALRERDGRSMSEANTKRLADLAFAVKAALDEIERLITDPSTEHEDQLLALYASYISRPHL